MKPRRSVRNSNYDFLVIHFSSSGAGNYPIGRVKARSYEHAEAIAAGRFGERGDKWHWVEPASGVPPKVDPPMSRDPRYQRFRTRVPDRKPDRCYVYRSKKGYNVTCAWASRRASRNFKTEGLAMRFAKGLRCKVLKGSEFSRLSKPLREAIQKKVPVIMRVDGFSRGQAFAAALSMALRGTLKSRKKPASRKGKARKKPARKPKRRASMKHKGKR